MLEKEIKRMSEAELLKNDNSAQDQATKDLNEQNYERWKGKNLIKW